MEGARNVFSHGHGVQLMGNKWMCFCKRTECGWNLTHTCEFHAEWAKNKSKFSLPATHEFRIKSGTATDTSFKGYPDTDLSSVGYSMTGSLFVRVGALAQKNGDKTKAVLEHYNRNVEDIDLSSVVANLQTAWGLN